MCTICFSTLGIHALVCGIFGAICAVSPVFAFSSHILNHCHSCSRNLRSITMKQFDMSTIITSFHTDENGSNGYVSHNPVDWVEKTAMVQQRWSKLYDKEESKRLQTAIMNQLYKDNFSDEQFASCNKWATDFNPLEF